MVDSLMPHIGNNKKWGRKKEKAQSKVYVPTCWVGVVLLSVRLEG